MIDHTEKYYYIHYFVKLTWIVISDIECIGRISELIAGRERTKICDKIEIPTFFSSAQLLQ